MDVKLDKMVTEMINTNTYNIDKVSTYEMVKIINAEDKIVAYAVEKELSAIAKAIDLITDKFKKNGRLIYCGAGTSGRLGILDAVECVPTYGVSDEMVMGIIAGGYNAIFKAQEGAEDSLDLCEIDLKKRNFNKDDVLVGITASGRTPYVIGGINYANKLGATTIGVTCNPDSEITKLTKIPIAPVVGPEVVTGSTRMKAGTAQKLVLNMLSTGAMIKLGKVYGNLMVDLKPSNIKLIERAKKIVSEATEVNYDEATDLLDLTNYNVKLAIFIKKTGLDVKAAKKMLEECDSHISNSIERFNLIKNKR
ncbi:N-acetylmuramic acid 6-phosphate etherase [Vallitalea longa]|uniref:N-acetylmuramic acid 6-phosphate etherase n=1 Tax=Vallitalea longa TaxID=2936439 RepID=A0A9W5YA62_9FIRM|nr:N-acetylmuramic acid 6-phosphate etherase [Vallitalea longa]GKX29727.1 N-acetylmuramic acid 6-phosphate etherase [Vallitalea longa]